MKRNTNTIGIVQDEQFLTTDQVAEMLGFSRSTVYALQYRGSLPCHRLPGSRKLIFKRSEIQRILDEGSING